jgi:hypothetical protein
LRNTFRYITACLVFLLSFSALAAAQDSTKRATPAATPGAAVNNPSLTVEPIVRPLESQRPRRRRRLTAADSLRLALQRDSIARVQAAALGVNSTPATASNSAFNIGTTPAPVTAQPTTDATAATQNTTPTVSDVPMLSSSDNPFEILRATAPEGDSTQATTAAPEPPADLSTVPQTLLKKETYSKNFLFWVFLLTLILMAFVVANARTAVGNAYRALLSDNALRQIYREQMGWGNVGQLALYGLAWLNFATFVFLMLYQTGGQPKWGQFWTFLGCLAGTSMVFFIKHAILYIIAAVFPISKEVRLYNYIIITAGILLGMILLPLNIFIAYVPASMNNVFVYSAIGAIALVYTVRSLRSLSVASPYMMTDQFHFLIYLCTVEIAPLAILVKLLTSQSIG